MTGQGGPALPPPALPPLGVLAEYLSQQRWYSGDGPRTIGGARTLGRLGTEPEVEIVAVTTARPGDSETYQLVLERRPDDPERLAHARVGDGEDGTVFFDALHDRDVTRLLPELIAADGRVGEVAFHPVARADGPRIVLDRPSIVLTGEQSNTTLVYGDAMVLKIYRRIAPGINPDVEVHLALDRVGCRHIAAPLGWIDCPDGTLAFLNEYLAGASQGWESAQASVRDLFMEGDLHPSDVGGDFAGEAERLGQVTAQVHADLREAFGTSVLDGPGLAERVQLMRSRLDAATVEMPELLPFASGLARAYDDLEREAAGSADVMLQRIHGDFHLGQALRTTSGWKLLDFEGEPETPREQRRLPDSPLRDVAGMIRSLDYAARLVLLDHPGDTQLAYRAAEWVEHNTGAFCAGYQAGSGEDPRDSGALLRAFEVEKAVYEVLYESRMRPGWLPIPLAGVARLAAA
jgi:maltokinase